MLMYYVFKKLGVRYLIKITVINIILLNIQLHVLAMPFVFCTREKFPWCEFAESVENGPSTTFLKNVFTNFNKCVIKIKVLN